MGTRARSVMVTVLLTLIVAGAAILRLWGLSQGGPLPNARPDEREMLEHTAAFASGDFNPRWFVYPNLFFWVSWAWLELVLGLERLVRPVPAYTVLLTTDLPRLLLAGRVLSVLVGTLTVVVLYATARRAGGRAFGLVAAFLLATNFLHVRDSHALKTESFLALGTLAAIALVARWAEDRTPRRAIAAGLAIGLTTGFKYNGILLLFPAWLADLWTAPQLGIRRLLPSRRLIGIAGVALGTFLVACPYLLLDWPRTQETYHVIRTAIFASRPQPPGAVPTPPLTERMRRFVAERAFVYHVTVSLRRGAGLAFALLTPVAVLAAFLRPRPPLVVLAASFTLLYYLVIGVSPVHLARYLTPITPLLALLVAWLLVRVAHALPDRVRLAALAVLTLGVAVEPLSGAIAYDRLAARTDTRVLATQWMAAHLPPGAVVAQLGTLVFGIADPELPPGVHRADLTLGQTDFTGRGVTHVVTHEHWLPFSILIEGQMKALRPHLRLLATFSPYPDGPGGRFEKEDAYYIPFWDFAGVDRPGPLVHIYAYEPSPEIGQSLH